MKNADLLSNVSNLSTGLMNTRRQRFFTPILLVLCLGVFVLELATNPSARRVFSPAAWTETRNQREILQFINANYLHGDELHKGDFSEQKIDRILSSVDPYSDYLSREEFADFEKETSQKYVGIGVQIANFEEGVILTKVFSGSPAEEVGLEVGDRILEVDGVNTRNSRVGRVVSLISGESGTRVALSVFRPETREYLTLNPERRSIIFESVVDVQMLKASVGYLRIIEFGERTGREFVQAIGRLEDQEMQHLVIDLRNNPGGMLNAAVEVAQVFFERGEPIVEVRGTRRGGDEILRSRTPERQRDYSIVVLINRGSASASEIVAGALRTTGRATLVGERTYGKGSVQSIYAFSNGEGLRMTTARYYLPDGTPIEDGVGLAPDIQVEVDPANAYKLRLQDFYGLGGDPEAFTRRFGFEPVEDLQLETALDLLLRPSES